MKELKNVDEIRRNNLIYLLSNIVKPKELASRTAWSTSYISQLKKGPPGGRRITEETARHLENALELGFGWMDVERLVLPAAGKIDNDSAVSINTVGAIPKNYNTNRNWNLVSAEFLLSKQLDATNLIACLYAYKNMTPEFYPGDELVIDRLDWSDLVDGEQYAFLSKGNQVAAYYVYNSAAGTKRLVSLNPDVPDEVVTANSITLLGKVVRLVRNYRA